MSPSPTRFLIALGEGNRPERLFLHVFDDGEAEAEMDWSANLTRALRFDSRDRAEAFVAAHKMDGAEVSEHAASDLDQPATHPFDRVTAVA